MKKLDIQVVNLSGVLYKSIPLLYLEEGFFILHIKKRKPQRAFN